MTVKQIIQDVVGNLPDDITFDDAIERIYLRKKIEAALRQVEAGDVIPHEEIEREFCADDRE